MISKRAAPVDLVALEDAMRSLLEPALAVEKAPTLELFRLLLWHLGEWEPEFVLLNSRAMRVVLEGGYGRIAAIVMKTYIGRGDEAELADDEALELICDELLAIDCRLLDFASRRKVGSKRRRRKEGGPHE